MKQLCDAPDLDIDGEYLKPHGDRCGLGSNLYAQDAELPQELLRHESIETSYESYREQNVTKRRERPEQALDVVSILSESELPPLGVTRELVHFMTQQTRFALINNIL
jgi:hypothetical protein